MSNADKPKVAETNDGNNAPKLDLEAAQKLLSEFAEKAPYWDFYFHLGFAINKWATIDRDVFTLFRFALNAKNDVKAAIIYYRMQSFSERLKLTDSLICLGLNDTQLKLWKKIVAEFDRLAPFRNRLAHDPSSAIIVPENPSPAWLELAAMARRRRRAPPYQSPDKPGTHYELNVEEAKLLRALNKPIPPPVRQKDIEKHSADLWQLQVQMALFLNSLPKRAVKRVLAPLSEPPQPKVPLASATKKTKSPNAPRRQRPPRP